MQEQVRTLSLSLRTVFVLHGRHRLIDRDLERAQNEFTQPKIKRLQFRGGITDPERQCGALDRDALAQQNLSLAIERQVPGIFGRQDIGHHRLGRQPALDQPLGRRRLDGASSQARQAYLGR